MPRSRSIFIQSDMVRRRSPRAFTAPAMRIAPPASSRFSVSVVLPASGCAMIANVRRRAASASGESVMGRADTRTWARGPLRRHHPIKDRSVDQDDLIGVVTRWLLREEILQKIVVDGHAHIRPIHICFRA